MEAENNQPVTDDEGNELGKIFIGGLAQETDDVTLREYFEPFGDLEEAVVMMDNRTQRSRGFGYVKFRSHDSVTFALSQTHVINGKEVDAKLCNVNMKGRNRRSLKVFLGGIAPETNEEDIRSAMSEYGTVTDVNLMMDPSKQRHRGFAYVGFATDSPVKQLIRLHFINIGSKQVEVKAMEPPRFGPRGPAPFMPPGPPGRGRGFRPPGPNGSQRPNGDWRGHAPMYSQSPPWASSWGHNPQQGPPPNNWGSWRAQAPSQPSWDLPPPPPPPPTWNSAQWNSRQAQGSNSGAAPPLQPPPMPPQWNGSNNGWGRDSRQQAQGQVPGHGYHPYKRG